MKEWSLIFFKFLTLIHRLFELAHEKRLLNQGRQEALKEALNAADKRLLRMVKAQREARARFDRHHSTFDGDTERVSNERYERKYD